MQTKLKIAILIPAHNEGKSLEKTLRSVLKVVDKKDVYVVNDGSNDNTDTVSLSLASRVLTIPKRIGKARATNQTISHYDLVDRYEYIMPIDADTIITSDFIKNALPIFEKDKEQKIACIVGKVTSKQHNWLTAFRIWEYEIAQTIHKKAQSIQDVVIICPGCSTIFRSNIFKQIQVPVGTLTEDMDLTFLIHRKNLGKIMYVDHLKVITQDPNNLKEFRTQLNRWYTGFWQCLIKHNIPWGGQKLDLEVTLIATEGLFNGILVLSLIFLIPIVLNGNPALLTIPLGVDLFLFLIPTLIFTGIKNKIYHILFYLPHFYFLRIFSSIVFLLAFVKVVFSHDLKMQWLKVTRY